ncbi:MAG: IS66 family insertion sequence element accessory protein TnpB [Polyangiaceae bacterium]
MLTLPPSVKIYVAVRPVDARKSFDGLAALIESEFGLEPLSGHLFVFLNRRAHVVQMMFWDRSGFCIVKKRLEAGSFKLVRGAEGSVAHVEIDSAELALMLEGIELAGATRRKRYKHDHAV